MFLAYLSKQYPDTKVSLPKLYQDTIVELWSQIYDHKITEDTLNCKLSTYIISIGKNKLKEETRNLLKNSKLNAGEPIYKKRKAVIEVMDKDEDYIKKYPLQSKKQQKELDTRINDILYKIESKLRPVFLSESDPMVLEELQRERQEKIEYITQKYMEMKYPCNMLLRYTWYDNMTDSKILEAFGGYFSNTDVIKSRRYKCHKTLLNMYNAWKISHE